MVTLADPLRVVLGTRTGNALAKALNLHTVADLLHHYPRRHYRRGELTDLAALREGEYVTVMARVADIRHVPYRDRRTGRPAERHEVSITDGNAGLLLTFFRRVADMPRAGDVGMFSGKVGSFRGRLQLVHPEASVLPGSAGDVGELLRWADQLVPVYPAVASFPSAKIARAVAAVLGQLDPVPDPLPADLLHRHALIGYDDALRWIHLPHRQGDELRAQDRLRYDEALAVQLHLAQRRHATAGLRATARPPRPGGLLERFDAGLPYRLTAGQQAAGGQLAADLARDHPMHRLLQGDVGSGKTLVALRAMLQVVDAGGQAVLLAPTEVLAHQHHANLVRLLGPLAAGGMLGGADDATRVALLTGSLSTGQRRAALSDLATGIAGIAVGTHALLQDTVSYHDLGLIVVDEQHRFGVEERSALLDRPTGTRAHLLVMTATPIPRTVALTVFGDLEVVTLSERPHGDPAIATHVVSETAQPGHLHRAWQRIREEVAAGRQVFVVTTRIEASDSDDTDPGDAGDPALFASPQPHALTDLARELSAGPLHGLRLGLLHGRMPAPDKDDVMRRFSAGPTAPDGFDVVLATTVIEVGVDIPAATMMVIMDADRFGVAQLHQLRGRIGRAGQPALCLLVTQATPGDPAFTRLTEVAATNDGFALADLDLRQRREGDVLGQAQSGTRSTLRLLSVTDADVIARARTDADAMVRADPALAAWPALAAVVAGLRERADYLEKA